MIPEVGTETPTLEVPAGDRRLLVTIAEHMHSRADLVGDDGAIDLGELDLRPE